MSRRPRRYNRSIVERQLRAEEAWLMEASRLVKAQRNALRIERLHLELERQRLQDLDIADNIASGSAGTSGTPCPKNESSTSGSTMSEVESMSQGSAQNNIPDNNEELNGMIPNNSVGEFGTSPGPSEGAVPLDTDKSEDATAKHD